MGPYKRNRVLWQQQVKLVKMDISKLTLVQIGYGKMEISKQTLVQIGYGSLEFSENKISSI
jgi:hypothetical protein